MITEEEINDMIKKSETYKMLDKIQGSIEITIGDAMHLCDSYDDWDESEYEKLQKDLYDLLEVEKENLFNPCTEFYKRFVCEDRDEAKVQCFGHYLEDHKDSD